MNTEFYKQKIKRLPNDKLSDLLRLSNNPSNKKIFALAKEECELRKLQVDLLVRNDPEEPEEQVSNTDLLNKWNWAAFALAPIWTLANNLEKLSILTFIPLLNIVVMFYLGFNGNRLAFRKSKIKSIEEFMQLQKNWSLWAVRIIWVGLFISAVAIFV